MWECKKDTKHVGLYKFYFGYLQQVLNIGYKYCPDN